MSRPIVVLVGSRILLRATAAGVRLPVRSEVEGWLGAEAIASARVPVRAGDIEAFALADGEFDTGEGFRLDGLRVAWHTLERHEFRAAGTLRQKVEWYRTHRYCSACGGTNELSDRNEAMVCSSCGQLHFPRIAPAVIVLVQRGTEALLGRSPRFDAGVYSTLAGFVEPGESLEECVHREILEEVGVRVGNLRYFGSQPHPFPHSLMIGFVADWIAGDIVIDRDEIEDARWFTASDLPTLPHPMSIARALIEDFVARTSG